MANVTCLVENSIDDNWINLNFTVYSVAKLDLFRLCPPVRYTPAPTPSYRTRVIVTQLHSKSLCKGMARASGGCKYYASTKLGGHKRMRFKNKPTDVGNTAFE